MRVKGGREEGKGRRIWDKVCERGLAHRSGAAQVYLDFNLVSILMKNFTLK